jgi:hypothetical protein
VTSRLESIDRESLAQAASRIGEVVAVVVAIAYAVGALSVLGQLRRLELHEPSVISGFAHDDVLMKGIGVLLTHAPSLASLGLLIGLALSPVARGWVRDTMGGAISGRDGRVGRIAFQLAFGALAVTAVLLSPWWEGTIVVTGTFAFLAFSWRSARLLTPGALLATAFVAALLTALGGTYLHPAPLPVVEVELADGPAFDGELLGSGQRGDLYVVLTEGDGYAVRIVPPKDAVVVEVSEPTGDRPERLLDMLGG